jgi:inorganic pyrophosphatase
MKNLKGRAATRSRWWSSRLPAAAGTTINSDEASGRMKLSKVGMVFPFDFGLFPGTKAEDGEPLDVLVLSDEPTFPGCRIVCSRSREIKVKKAKNRNDRIVGVAEASVVFSDIKGLEDISR